MFKISHSEKLKWELNISWSKNAALPIIAANCLTNNQVEIKNLPDIKDVHLLKKLWEYSLNNSKKFFDLNNEYVSKLRASILLIPIGLSLYEKVHFCGSGGCKIGKRPLDTFDNAFWQAWVEIEQKKWYKLYTKKTKPQKEIVLQEFSVTTTEALITYLAFLSEIDFDIRINQIAIEPHVINLIEFLNANGANIKINYDHSVTVTPQKIQISKKPFEIIWDYIEAWTYFGIWAIAPDSEITIKNFNVKDIMAVLNIADKIWINYEIIDEKSIKVNSYNRKNYRATKLQTMIYPGFPTDLQSIFGVILTQAKWISKLFETLFEWRFAYLTELENLGAQIEILNPHQVIVIWPTELEGGYVSTTDLRWWGAMILAGIMAKWTTYITNEDIILRWYSNIVEKLKNIGVEIEKVS